VLAHSKYRTCNWQDDPQQDHGDAQDYSPAQKTEQNAWDDQDRYSDQPVKHPAKCAARPVMFVFDWVGFMLDGGAAV
jgi:hypothetical protein